MRQLRRLSLLLGLLLLGPSAYAQSVRFQSQAISSRGAGIANATVAVCTQPANTNTQPCSPRATLATSTITTSGGANPLTADSFGNFFFYAAPGRYTVQIYGPAVSGQFVTPDVELASTGAGTPITTGTLDNIKIIDGVKYAFSAAGINQADTDLTTANGAGSPGEIWLGPGSTTATDAQISINDGHTLKVMGTLTIDAAGKGPILMGKYSKLECAGASGSTFPTVNIVQANSSSITSMIRARVQDGSLETFYVRGCQIYAGLAPVTRGVIDVTGMNDRGIIQDNIIVGWLSGYGIFGGNDLGLTGQFTLRNNWVITDSTSNSSTGGCIYLHGTSTTNLLYDIQLEDNECQTVGTGTNHTTPFIVIDNTTGNSLFVRDINIQGLYTSVNSTGATDGVKIDGVKHATIERLRCGNGGASIPNCLHVTTNANNSDIEIGTLYDNIIPSSGGNALVDDNAPALISPLTQAIYPYIYKYPTILPSVNVETNFGPNLRIIPKSNFQGLQVGFLGDGSHAGVQVPAIDLLTGSINASARNWRLATNNNTFGDLEFVASTSNSSAPSSSILTLTGSFFAPTSVIAFDLGATATPFTNLWLGTAATNNFKFQPAATAGARIVALSDPSTSAGSVTMQVGLNYNATSGYYQSKRGTAGCTTSGGASAFTGPCTTTITFPASFLDTNFSVTCMGRSAFTGVPILQGATATAVNTATVQTQQATGVNASFATIDCIAVHD